MLQTVNVTCVNEILLGMFIIGTMIVHNVNTMCLASLNEFIESILKIIIIIFTTLANSLI